MYSVEKEPFSPYPANIKIIGIGGAGGNAVNRMINFDLHGVDFIAANTDVQALKRSKASVRLQLGEKLTKGLGVGGNPILGEKAASEDIDRIKEIISGTDMIFLTAGMGGGTGTGGAPIFAKVARDFNILTVGVVTFPFSYEGKVRENRAVEGIAKLKEWVDALIVIQNQKIFDIATNPISCLNAWEKIDDVLRQSIQSITDVITGTGVINLDLNDVKAIMTNSGEALMGVGEASGENRAIKAAEMAMNLPFFNEKSIKGATKGVLVNITGNKDIKMNEVKDIMDMIHKSVSSQAEIFSGLVVDDTLEDKIKVSLIATNTKDSFANIINNDKMIELEKFNKHNLMAYQSVETLKLDSIPAYFRRRNKN